MSDRQALYLEVVELAMRAFEDDLDEAGRAHLAGLLEDSREAREIYQQVMFSISALAWDCGPQGQPILASAILGQAIAPPAPEPTEDIEDTFTVLAELESRGEAVPVDLTDELAKRQRAKRASQNTPRESAEANQAYRVLVIPRVAVYAALAACLLLGSWLVWIAWPEGAANSPIAESVEDAPAPPGEDASPAPAIPDTLATLVRTHHAAWSGTATPRDGADLKPGSLHLAAGYAELRMQRGAVVLVQAPARFELVNDNTIKLIDGNVVAEVPPAAKFFTVQTPTATIVDFGTNFGVSTAPDTGTVAAVFEGEVELRGNAQANDEPASLRLTAGQAGQVDASGELDTQFRSLLSKDRLTFVPSWEVAERGWRISGQIQEPEAERLSLWPGDWESDTSMLLIPERKSQRLSRELLVREPRGEISDQVPLRRLEAGTAVDSYTIHFDAVGRREYKNALFLEAKVRFDRPILGVIYGYYQYMETVEMLGSPNVLYPESIQLLGIEPGEDHIEISDDGKTLELRLGVSDGVDQIRVLVKAEESRND